MDSGVNLNHNRFTIISIVSVKVDEADIHEMFAFADKDKDGRISYRNVSLHLFYLYSRIKCETKLISYLFT